MSKVGLTCWLFCFGTLLALVVSFVGHAKMMRTDGAGKPVYNSWQRFENERKTRNRVRNQHNQNPAAIPNKQQTVMPSAPLPSGSSVPAGAVPDANLKNSAHPAPTPSSVILNRPVQIQGEPGNEDFDF